MTPDPNRISRFCDPAPEGIFLSLKVQPRSRRSGFQGLTSDQAAVKWAVQVAPEDGKANQAVITSLADFFGIARSSVRLENGQTSRLKRFRIVGVTLEHATKLILEAELLR